VIFISSLKATTGYSTGNLSCAEWEVWVGLLCGRVFGLPTHMFWKTCGYTLLIMYVYIELCLEMSSLSTLRSEIYVNKYLKV